MDIVIVQSKRIDRLGAGSQHRGLCSDPINSRRIVMKNLWGLGSHSSGRICIILEHKETKGHCIYVPKTLPLGRWLSLKKGGADGVRDAPSGQPSRKKRKLEDLDNDLATMTHDEGEEDIDDINANGYGNDNNKTVEGETVEGGHISGRI
eukprot:scaffold1776_cov297-Chaetoceros_neogracile.AAC.1